MKILSLLALIICSFLSALVDAVEPSPYYLENTEVRDIHATSLKRDYQVYVALPDSYQSSNKRYAVLFVADANYSFAIVRNIAQRLNRHAGMEEVIVVGLSYAKGEDGTYSRRRDYTPTIPRKINSSYQSTTPGQQHAFGEGAEYSKFLSSEVIPLIARHYRANLNRKVFIGHSYGSLLGLQILFTQPQTFNHYILGSPSLWYDAGIMFERERGYAASHRDLPASVFFGIGGLERLAPGKKRSRAEEKADMVEDLQEFNGLLKSHKYPNLNTRIKIFDEEDHASVFPFLLTHGLRAYLKSSK